MVKRNKVVAMLMAGLMAVSPISQPVSIYASESDVETVVQEEPSEEVQEKPAAEPEISDESTELEESSAPQEDIDINYDDSGGDMFSDGSTEDLSVFDTEEQEATVQSLQWTGRINETDITAKLSCESGSEMDASDILDIKETEKEAKKELETKISAMAVNSCASVKFGFDVSRKDKNGEEKEKNISYKISLNMADISALKGLKLYHQKENGDMEELTFTAGSDENGGQKVEFVSAEGLGSFVFTEISEDLTVNEETNTSDAPKNDTAVQDSEENIEDLTVNTENISEEPQVTEEDAAAGNTQENPDADQTGSVVPVDISEFQVSFVSGAENADGKNVWNPSDPTKGHSFIYRVNYTMSGTFSTDIGAFKIELPLHILKDKDGNWADTFNCPYWLRSEVTEEDNPDFVYEIDEENNKVTIYNYKPYPTGEAGYVEFSYETTKDTMQYLDMGASTKVHAKVYATNESSTVTKESEADEVYIDTHATIAYTQKKKPTLYREWNEAWGEKPAGAENYYYLVWPIRSYVNKNTSIYDFSLSDIPTEMDSEVIGYKFFGQTEFSQESTITGISMYGDRYDYVLTRYNKAKADELTNNKERYFIHNDIEATVSPIDRVDEDSKATSSYDWFYEAPKYFGCDGDFWAEKYGVYGEYTRVESSEDISNYALGEFESGEIDSLSYLKYRAICDGAPYAYTLADGATGTVDDALNGLYWQKKVDYDLIDDGISIEGTKLDDADYDIGRAEVIPVIKDATFDESTYTFKSKKKTSGFNDSDNIDVFVRTADGWNKAATYNLNNKMYENINNKYIKNTDGRIIEFNAGVKALEYKCSHAYFYTELNIYPELILYRTEHMQEILKSKPEKIAVTNEIDYIVTQGDKTMLNRHTQGTDYVQKVTRESEIKKDVVKTENIKRESRFEVTWNVNFQEKYIDDKGIHYIYQNSGKFYDLLPTGCDFNADSLVVTESGIPLGKGEYDYSLTYNYKNSGRILLTVTISSPTKNEYAMQYNTSHDYNSINDYGRNLLNSVVYESGNTRIGEGFPDDGGNITDKEILKDIDPDTDAEKFVYSEARYEVNFPVAAVTGLKKQVKNSTSKSYSYNEVVHKNEWYSYKVRMTNDSSTKAKNIVFFDSLENFYQNEGQGKPTLKSDWHGALKSVDVSQIEQKGAAPVVYLSKLESMNPNEHNDLGEVLNGEPVWLELSEFEKKYGFDKAAAIAIDASKREDGSEFLLDEKESVSFVIYMQAPSEDTSGKKDPVAYNNIFVRRTAIKEIGNEVKEIDQFYHQEYTQAHYRVSGDFNFKKVDATDVESVIKGATYKLTGTSDYGTFYDEERTSNKKGKINFKEIEKGKYELREVSCSDDWLLDKNVYTVVIDGKGNVEIAGLAVENGEYVLTDEPRYHADIVFQKINPVTNGNVEGAVFKLTGISDYDNDYTLYAKSNKIGRVSFKNIDMGTYELKEVEAPEGYIKNKTVFTVKIDENGRVSMFDGDKKLEMNNADIYEIENEPYHSVRFLKSSTYGDNIYLEGAEFNLSGISDYGTNVNMTAMSGKAEDGGLVIFDGLEPGVYTLKETKAPEGHYLDEKPYKVTLKKDGTFTIDGLEKIRFGDTTDGSEVK